MTTATDTPYRRRDNYEMDCAALKAIRAHRPDHADSAWDAVDEAIAKAEGRP